MEITFEGYSGAVEALVVDTNELTANSGAVVSAEVTTVQEGTEPLQGDFTLSFQGQETPALSFDADASEVCHQVSTPNFQVLVASGVGPSCAPFLLVKDRLLLEAYICSRTLS